MRETKRFLLAAVAVMLVAALAPARVEAAGCCGGCGGGRTGLIGRIAQNVQERRASRAVGRFAGLVGPTFSSGGGCASGGCGQSVAPAAFQRGLPPTVYQLQPGCANGQCPIR